MSQIDSSDGPIVVLKTWYGSLQYTTNDLSWDLASSKSFLLQTDVSDFMSKSLSDIPLEQFYKGHVGGRYIMSVNERVAGSSNDSGVYVDTNSGRNLVTIDEYIRRVQLEKPAMVIAMADEVPYSCGKRKLLTAVKRSQIWFEKMRSAEGIKWEESVLVGVVIGNKCEEELGPDCVAAQTRFLLQNGAQAILVGGVGQGETAEERSMVIRCVKDICVMQQRIVPVMLQRADSIKEIAQAVRDGVDIISTDYPGVLTAVGQSVACDYLTEARHYHNGDRDSAVSTGEISVEPPAKRSRLSESAKDPLGALVDADCVVNLWDPKYKRDMTPLQKGCTCHCCRNYTKAYLHHLLVCHEMLAEIMIYCHNQKATLRFFDACRELKGHA